MPRIRTIKPEFFTSGDIACLPPLARLLFIGLLCEADREGRLKWDPNTLKMRYLASDECDVDVFGDAMEKRNLIRRYDVDGNRYAVVVTFKDHQVVNNRERESTIPPPPGDAVPLPKKAPPPEKPSKPVIDYDAHAAEWNELAKEIGVSEVKNLSAGRRAKLKMRLAEKGFSWNAILQRAHTAFFVHGAQWFNFDWVVANDTNYLKLLEGKYDQAQAGQPKPSRPERSDRPLGGGE